MKSLKPFDLSGWLKANEHRLPPSPPPPRYACLPATPQRSAEAVRRASGWLRGVPGAVAGQGGHRVTFRVAIALRRGFALTRDDAKALMREWNHACVPEWDERSLDHKLDDAERVPCREPDGWMLAVERPRRQSVWPDFTDPDNDNYM
jgi:hypothetical protein